MSKRYESDTFRTRLYDYLTFDSTIPELLRVKKPYGKSRRATGEPVSFAVSEQGYANGKRRLSTVWSRIQDPVT